MSATDQYARRNFVNGDVIISEGAQGRAAYLVQSGMVEVFRVLDGTEVVLSKLGVGEIFGEMSLLFDEPRSASVRCIQDSIIIRVEHDTFKAKLGVSDPTIRAIIQMLSRRILAANETLLMEQRDLDSLIGATRTLFENVVEDLPEIKKRVFEEGIRPKFEAFVQAIEELEDRFEIDVPED